ncbi:MAG TPA: DNA internalization-related competence protein ComEC/Rec2 [Myxococcales bacterium]|nr:DNA internalization-related competence protein ComEC/Rec2 [Myxococcales bacterium]
MGAMAAIGVGFLLGAWAAVLGIRLPFAWMACVVVLAASLLVAVSTTSAAVQPGARGRWIFFALALLTGQAVAPARSIQTEVPSGVARVEGVVERVVAGRRTSAVLRVRDGALLETGRALHGTSLAITGLDAPAGTHLRAIARVRPATRFHNEGPHPEWPSARGVDGFGRVVGQPEIARPAPAWRRLGHGLRARLRRSLEATLSPDAAAVSRALLLGETRALETDRRAQVRDAGLSHVLAVSGLHVTLLAGALVLLFGFALARMEPVAARFDTRRLAHGLGIPAALSYALLVGDAPSAWRAAVTASLAWGLTAAGRKARPVAVTALAALVLGLTRPDDLARPGFALSIVATASLVTGAPTAGGFLRAGLVVAARTMVATAPIVVWLFGDLPLVGLLANVVVVPLAALLLLPLVAIHAASASLLSGLGDLTGPLVEATASAFFATCEVFASVPLGRDLPPLDLAQGVALTIGCVLLLASSTWSRRLVVCAVLCLTLAGAELHLRHRERPEGILRVTYLDVGQGDGALVDLPDGRLMVVDAGGAAGGGPDPGARVLVPLLRARRRSRVDVLVLSHPHPDHYGGMHALLEEVEIGEIWDSGQADVEQPEGAAAGLLAGRRVRHPPELCQGPRAFGRAVVRVRWPCPDFDAGWGPNDNSLVLEIAHGEHRFLFTGDIEAHGEAGVLPEARPVDVLKVAHHGSRTSSDEALLRRLRPRVAVVSAGRQNRFGHPHPEVWERLTRLVPRVFRTDRDGGVTVVSDGRTLEVSTARALDR